MKIQNEHWFYYLNLEDEMLETSKYVQFNHKNLETNSYRFMEIIINAATEFETLLKALYGKNSVGNLLQNHLYKEDYDFKTLDLSLIRFDLTIQPYETEIIPNKNPDEQPKTPIWWNSGYNDIKHDKMTVGLEHSTLHNSLKALASLYTLLIFIYRHKDRHGDLRQDIFRDATTKSKLFHTPINAPFGGVVRFNQSWNTGLPLKDDELVSNK